MRYHDFNLKHLIWNNSIWSTLACDACDKEKEICEKRRGARDSEGEKEREKRSLSGVRKRGTRE